MKRAILLMALLAAGGCGGSSTSASSLPPTSVGTFTVTDLVIGTGATAVTGNTLTVAYSGWLYDTGKPNGKGAAFQSNPSFQFQLGGNVISGWNQGVPGMQVGGQRRLILPPDQAYGASSPDPATIPNNATLVFEITLKSIP
jgi:FKBP-type peptidyl-prolyl cis-trans isomerase FkpA